MSDRDKEPADVFHEHLDACRQCEENPFDLCAAGQALLEKAGRAIAAGLDVEKDVRK